MNPAAAPQHHPPVPSLGIDLVQLVREVLDGLVGDFDLPFPDQAAACAAVEQVAEAKAARPLTSMGRQKIGLEVAIEWNRRAQIAERTPRIWPGICACGHPQYNHSDKTGACRRHICGCQQFAPGTYAPVPKAPFGKVAS
jgi:hypothetical protein